MDIHFIEEKRIYRGKGYTFTQPGVYTVDDAFGHYAVAAIPQWFQPVDAAATSSSPAQTDQTPETNTQAPKPVSKMNRAELEAHAAEIGLEVTAELDTNDKLKAAMKEHESKEQ